LDEGWHVIRTVPGHPSTGGEANLFEPRESVALTAEWMAKLREEVGLGPVLGIDYHHRLSVAEAASFCQRMPSGTLDFLEEPIRAETPEAYEVLRSMVDVPLAIGEEFSSKWAFLPYIERGLTNFARIDVCNVGGLTEAVKVAGWAEAHYIDLMPHNPLGPICTAATIHLAAAVPNFAWLEIRTSPTEDLGFYDRDLFPVQPKLEGSRFPVPEGPGLGVEFDEALAAKRPFKFWEGPHLHRRDGSHTNW
jgi:galactonate dehydratase